MVLIVEAPASPERDAEHPPAVVYNDGVAVTPPRSAFFFYLLLVVVSPRLGAQEAAERAGRLFLEVVRPALEQQCFGCHGQANTFSKLDLTKREAALEGGLKGPAIVPGDPEASLLVRAVEFSGGLAMPPGGEEKKLPTATIAAIRDWVAGGAPYATGEVAQKWNYDEEDVWAFRPLADFEPPTVEAFSERVRTPVDAFLFAALEQAGLEPAPRADRRTLIRRVTFDLTGLPPAPEEVEAFVNDPAPDDEAWKTVVERLLASPRYGERQARHWLDVVRYADTSGYSNDFERPNAWRYRDYVIRSFNEDKPYDRFTLEQIAGDELFPDGSDAIIATGFLRAGPWEHTGMSVAAETRQMWLDDVTHSTATTFLGLTLGCARCHDHKFDPIPTKDYYRVQATFASSAFARRPLPFEAAENVSAFDTGRGRFGELIEQLERKMAEFEERGRQRLAAEKGAEYARQARSNVVQKYLTPEEQEALKLFRKQISIHKESAERYEPLAFSVTSGLVEEWNDVGPNGSNSYLKQEDYVAPEMHVLVGGALASPGEEVAPGALSAVERYSGFPAPHIPEEMAGRRAALARWIADERNPLTARVMVNRIWQQHFGRGLAANPNNLGKMGGKPTHPELLDWLARSFIENGWSLKALHRMILLSDAYRRASAAPQPDVTAEKDPENKLLSYSSPRRLEAEALRDAMLAVSGQLSLDSGGPGTYPQINRDVAEQPRHAMGSLRPTYWVEPTPEGRNRRSIYSFQQRSLVDPLIEVFNGPPMDLSCERRDATTVPTQAFSLFNSELSHDLALAFAARLVAERDDDAARLERAFRLAFGRAPSPEERDLALSQLEAMRAYHEATPPPAKQEREPLVRSITSELTGENFRFEEPPLPWDSEENLHPSDVSAETRAWADVALALFNANEFAYVY